MTIGSRRLFLVSLLIFVVVHSVQESRFGLNDYPAWPSELMLDEAFSEVGQRSDLSSCISCKGAIDDFGLERPCKVVYTRFGGLILAIPATLAAELKPSGCSLIVVPIDYPTIQDAINAACPGATIEVLSGIYRENVKVDRRLVLRGIDRGAGVPVIDASGWVSGVTLLGNGITLEGFVVTNSGLGSGVDVRSSCNIIKNNTITKNLLNGMKFKGDVTGNIVIWNNITHNGFSGIVSKGRAVDNTVARNEIKDNGFEGISFDGEASGNRILVNNVSRNGFVGIQFKSNATGNMIVGNVVSNNSFGGIDLKGSACSNLITDNRVFNNTFTGLSLSNDSSDNLLMDNYLLFNLEHDAYDTGSNNHWDNETIGNYYSEFFCEDKDRNGICDSPCWISGGSSLDRYPLASPAGASEPPEIQGILAATNQVVTPKKGSANERQISL